MWHPGRKKEELTDEEKKFAEHKEKEDGVMMWCVFNSSLNSSTRCELAAAILAMFAPTALNIGVDNATVVKRGNEIIEHMRRREKEIRRDERG